MVNVADLNITLISLTVQERGRNILKFAGADESGDGQGGEGERIDENAGGGRGKSDKERAGGTKVAWSAT
jgi:hypothetical protein